MERSPSWEANNHSSNPKIPCLLWNPKVHYRVHKSTSLDLNLSQMHPVHKFPPSYPKIHSNLIFPLMARSSECTFPYKFSNRNIVCISHLSHACYMPRPFHPLLDRPNDIQWSVRVIKLLIMPFFQPPSTSYLWGPNILLIALHSALCTFFP